MMRRRAQDTTPFFLVPEIFILVMFCVFLLSQGVHAHPSVCWTETKQGTNLPQERICGDVSTASEDSTDFSDGP